MRRIITQNASITGNPIINNEVVKEGDLLGDAKVVSIGDRKITLDEHGRRYELGLP